VNRAPLEDPAEKVDGVIQIREITRSRQLREARGGTPAYLPVRSETDRNGIQEKEKKKKKKKKEERKREREKKKKKRKERKEGSLYLLLRYCDPRAPIADKTRQYTAIVGTRRRRVRVRERERERDREKRRRACVGVRACNRRSMNKVAGGIKPVSATRYATSSPRISRQYRSPAGPNGHKGHTGSRSAALGKDEKISGASRVAHARATAIIPSRIPRL